MVQEVKRKKAGLSFMVMNLQRNFNLGRQEISLYGEGVGGQGVMSDKNKHRQPPHPSI